MHDDGVEDDGQAHQRRLRLIADSPQWGWPAGSKGIVPGRGGSARRIEAARAGQLSWTCVQVDEWGIEDLVPDVEDDATLGCLRTAVRKLYPAHTVLFHPRRITATGPMWIIETVHLLLGARVHHVGRTEGEALARAFVYGASRKFTLPRPEQIQAAVAFGVLTGRRPADALPVIQKASALAEAWDAWASPDERERLTGQARHVFGYIERLAMLHESRAVVPERRENVIYGDGPPAVYGLEGQLVWLAGAAPELAPALLRHEGPYQPLRLLWHSNYWDGPLSGLALLDGREKVWVEAVVNDPRAPRIFTVYRVPEALLAEREKWHDLFRKHVGGHTDYTESGTIVGRPLHSGREAADRLFFAPYKAAVAANPNLAMPTELLATCEKLGLFHRLLGVLLPLPTEDDADLLREEA